MIFCGRSLHGGNFCINGAINIENSSYKNERSYLFNSILSMISLRHIVAASGIAIFGSFAAYSQKNEFNPVQTGVNSLGIAPDARGASMGDLGAATDPDANSQYWNPSKYAFAYSRGAVSLSYTPWLRKLVNDIFLANVAGYWKIGTEDNQAVSASLRYFSLGEMKMAGWAYNP